MSASRVLRGASRTLLRPVATRSRSLPQHSLAASRRCVSSLNVESQQKVREPGSTPVADESAPANQKTATQLLATHLKEADPAMYDIIENASLPTSKRFWARREEKYMLTTFRQTYRRRKDKSTSSTSFPPRTSHHRRCWMPWAVPCKVRNTWKRTSRTNTCLHMVRQTNTRKGTPGLDTMVATSLSTPPRGYANRGHWRPLAWTKSSGESTSSVCVAPRTPPVVVRLMLTLPRSAVWCPGQPLHLFRPHEHARATHGP